MLLKVQDELKRRCEELHVAQETVTRLGNEKQLLEQRIQRFEKKKADEVTMSTLVFIHLHFVHLHGQGIHFSTNCSKCRWKFLRKNLNKKARP